MQAKNPGEQIEKGCLVKITDSMYATLLPNLISEAAAYRVLDIDKKKDIIYLGPTDMPPHDVANFNHRKFVHTDKRYTKVFSIAPSDVLRRLLD